ncbi:MULTISPECIES: hypothetical protein [Streptomyces]|uniref:hypothetical protein n=1 Tax=Streptomyces TaxID=1883 RepID=UPI00206DB379|nr:MULTISPECIES: hypothetical protein [Streptomyces]UPT41799.1 hypothetical protein MWG59_10365 [Streptomyces sp. WAC00303]WIY76032.1 hypothetical protein QPM16_10225 [Streptomyces anulatus]
MNTDDEKGQQMPLTPATDQQGFAQTETLEGYGPARTPADYDPEDVQFAARTDDGDVVMYLPEITYLDTQPWSVEIGLTPERLVQLRDALDNHLRGAADHGGAAGPSVVGQSPTTVVQQPTVLSVSATERTVAQQATDVRDHLSLTGDSVPSGTSVASQREATVAETAMVAQTLARVSAAVDTPSGLPEEPTSEYGIGWDTAMDLVRAAIEEQP